MPITLTQPIPRTSGLTISLRELNVQLHPTVQISFIWHLVDVDGTYVTGGSEVIQETEALAWLRSSGVGRKLKQAAYKKIKNTYAEYGGTDDDAI